MMDPDEYETWRQGLLLSAGITRPSFLPPCVMGDDEIMRPRAHGTSETGVQEDLRWGCCRELADRICNFNRKEAEPFGYFETTAFLDEEPQGGEPPYYQFGESTFYDSNTGKPLFFIPRGRPFMDFAEASHVHGWFSFRDAETNWDLVRCLSSGEVVSLDGTHLGHNFPDTLGNRYCINLVSVAGRPRPEQGKTSVRHPSSST
mmetsp:Transcript_3435/g.6949  ORF Transcript_3435/g.6949 Transcript_3435/m.6949 type:complete len:203 (+) Transcript_3435:55-663(+)